MITFAYAYALTNPVGAQGYGLDKGSPEARRKG